MKFLKLSSPSKDGLLIKVPQKPSNLNCSKDGFIAEEMIVAKSKWKLCDFMVDKHLKSRIYSKIILSFCRIHQLRYCPITRNILTIFYLFVRQLLGCL